MLKLINISETACVGCIWECRNLSSLIMKIFVSVITFFKSHIRMVGVKAGKLEEIGVKMSLISYLSNRGTMRKIEEGNPLAGPKRVFKGYK